MRLQFVSNWPKFLIHFRRLDRSRESMSLIYKWYLGIGFWHLRCWNDEPWAKKRSYPLHDYWADEEIESTPPEETKCS